MQVGELLKRMDSGDRRRHDRAVLDRQRPAFQHLAGCGKYPLPQREELELGRRLPRSGLHPLARKFPAGTTLNGIVSHQDWLLDRPFIIFGTTAIASKFLNPLVELPPSQTPGSFNLDAVKKQIESLAAREN